MKDALKMKTHPGQHISDACAEAVKVATEKGFPVTFIFNNTTVLVQPGETAGVVEARWSADMVAARKAWLESPEYKEREAAREEEHRKALAAHMTEGASTEQEMRDAKVPTPLAMAQLEEYVNSLVERSHDYGTCCYAMSMAATAAFNYVASKLGVTGFQASCADLDILRRTRHLEGPFLILKAEDALYPQYNLHGKLQQALDEWTPWLKEQAEKQLAATTEHVHPEVLAHWTMLAK